MNADERGLKHEGLTEKIFGVSYEVYNELGYGLLEPGYEAAREVALVQAGFKVARQGPIAVYFRGVLVGEFCCEVLLNDVVISELKGARALESGHEAQVLNELRATPIEVGLLLNFGPKASFKRFAFSNDRNQIRVDPRSSAAGFS